MKLDRALTGLVVAGLAPATSTPLLSQQFDLLDVTERIGIDVQAADGRMGIAVGDYDDDGWQDVCFFGTDDHTPELYRNQGALIAAGMNVPWFVNVSDSVFPAGDIPTSLGAFVDLDNDGDQDLALIRRGFDPVTDEPSQRLCAVSYYENTMDVNGQFTIGTSNLRVGATASTATSMAIVDYDGDSDLDIFASFSGFGGDFSNSRCYMVRNDGLPELVDVSPTMGPALATTTRALTAVFADFNGDMLCDLHCSRDFFPDFQCRNLGGGMFEDVSGQAGVTNTGSDMGLAVGDFDNDLDLDIYSTNINYGVLYVNDGAGHFTNEATVRGVRSFANGGTTTIGWGTAFVDFDLDGDLDLSMVPTGPGTGNVWQNDGTGHFTDVTIPTGITLHGYALVDFDFDRDGDRDFITLGNTIEDSPSFYINTQETGRHWLAVELEGTQSNRDAIGAVVYVTLPDGSVQMRPLMAGYSYRCGTTKVLHFGLDDATTVTQVEVRWPSGQVTTAGPFAADQYITLTE